MSWMGPLTIIPNYDRGFQFSWTITADVTALPPWRFRLQQSDTGRDSWTTVYECVNLFSYTEPPRPKFNFDISLYFRIEADFGGSIHYSSPRTVLGDLSKRDFLIAREIMRQVNQTYDKGRGGHPVEVWQVIRTGILCTACRDEVSQQILDKDCRVCFGTGSVGGYHGPYPTHAQFSLKQSRKELKTVMDEVPQYQITLTAGVHINRQDLIVDVPSRRVYEVLVPASVHEIRRIPTVYTAAAVEIPPDRQVYALGGEAIDHV